MTAAVVNHESAMTNDLVAKSALDVDWPKIGRLGAILALALVFMALTGMPVGLDRRLLIDPVLSLGYLALLWLPFLFGRIVANEVVLEGMSATKKGPRDIVAGASVGALGGLGLSVLALLLNSFDLRDPLVNWSPALLEFLNFGRGNAVGLVAWIIVCAALGAFGASLHLMTERVRRAVLTVILAVTGIAIFESFIIDLVDPLKGVLYSKTGGLTLVSALVVAALALAMSLGGGGDRIRAVKSSYDTASDSERSRQTAMFIGIAAVALIIIPMITGKITQELLANVGIFLLLALGLNIVVGLTGILDLGYVAFFAVGGYTTAVLTSANRGEDWPSVVPRNDSLAVGSCCNRSYCRSRRPVHWCSGHPDARRLPRYRHARIWRDHPPLVPVRLAEWLLQRCPGHHQHRACELRLVRSEGNRPQVGLLPGVGLCRDFHLRVMAVGAVTTRTGVDGRARG